MDPKFAGKPVTTALGRSSARSVDIEQMSDTPTRRGAHRRAHSDTFFRFDNLDLSDDILLDDVMAPLDFNLDDLTETSGGPPQQANGPDSNGNMNSSGGGFVGGGTASHLRSLSVDADFFEGLGLGGFGNEGVGQGGGVALGAGPRHRPSSSMDGSSESESSIMMAVDSAKKAMGSDKLAELALIDPKRAKRILANRQSAARSKERKIRYTGELERKVQTLQTEATTLSAQVTMLQRDTNGLTAENKELKMRLQAMEQQAHLRDALNEALREEVQRLKIATGQIPAANGSNYNRAFRPPLQSQNFHHFGGQQAQQQQQQLQMPQSASPNPNFSRQQQSSFQDFNQRV